MKHSKGFTLAELLIVVAIIAVLVAVSIPVFTKNLERAREAADLANVRAAYAEVMVAAMSEDQDSPFYAGDGVYRTSVSLKQKKDDWQDNKNLSVGSVSSTDKWNWRGYPMAEGDCEITYEVYTERMVLDWSGRNIATNLGFMESSWSTGAKRDSDHKKDIISTNNPGVTSGSFKGLYELTGNTTYQVSFTYDPHLSSDQSKGVFAKANLVYDEKKGKYIDSGTGPFLLDQDVERKDAGGNVVLKYRYTKNTDGTVTYTATFSTGAGSKYYYGMNFGGMAVKDISTGELDNTKSGIRAFTDPKGLGMTEDQLNALKKQIGDSFTLVKVSK